MVGQLNTFEASPLEAIPLEKTQLSEAKILLLEKRMRGATGMRQKQILPRDAGSRTPLSVEQHRLWLHAAMDPDLPIYNELFTIHKRGAFDLCLLEDAFNEMLRRHEIWRTYLEMQQGEWLQVVTPELKVKLALIDLSALPLDQRETEASRIATDDSAVPIDLQTAPLFRIRVLRMDSADHRLQITIHHILFDGVSIHRIFVPELAAIYAALERGEAHSLAEPQLQYGDYALWQQSQKDTPQMEKYLDFWRTELAGELPIQRLPSNRPRPAVVSHRGAVEYIALPEELMDSIRTLGRIHGASVYMILLAALKILIFRYTNQEDVLIGGLVDGRRRPELEQVMGYFLDTFIIRTFPSSEQTFSSYLTRIRETVLGALDAAEAPFSRVVQMLHRKHDTDQIPLIQTFLAFQPEASRFAEGWDLSKTKANVAATKFELYIEVEERAGASAARIVYSTDLFDADTIRRLAGHWMTLLAGAAKDPERTLGELPLLSPEEKEQMLVRWNQTEAPVPQVALHEMVSATAKRNPEATAVEFQGESCTYLQLEQSFECFADHLLRAGARRGEIVAVCLNRSQHLPAVLLGVLKTGAAYLPLDPGAPFARLQLCLEDAAPAILLTQQSLLDELPPTKATVVLLEDVLAAAVLSPCIQEPVLLDDAAYIIHTSGSTGRPKAVEISHRALINFLESMRVEPGFSSTDTLLAVTTLSFDIAGLELFLPLITGGRVVIASREVAQDPYLLATAIKQSSCTVMQATPATWRALLDTGWQGRPGLRVLCGGEPMTVPLAKRLIERGMELWNLYGPTETTVWSTVQRITRVDRPISVGRPIANTTIYILDARQQPVPVDVAGDLYIGGMGLANCYRDQPKLTAEKFRTPAVAGGARLYLTGDTALYRADGTIEVQGRTDNQVKIRGFRIELEEVEAGLAAHPCVASAAVKAWPDATGGHRLCAYVVGRGGPPPTAIELHHFLASRLPSYMIPSAVIALDALPITLNGKMDRKALTPPDTFAAPSSACDTQAPDPRITPEERRLTAIWSELLGLETISLHDNFFELGGHSLLVARLQYRMDLEFGLKLPMASLFHAPTIAQQMELLSEAQSGPSTPGILSIQPHGEGPRLFWTHPPPRIGKLAAAMGVNQPFFGVSITLADMEKLGPDPDLEAFARLYADAITRFQSKGPYHIGGLCTGGILAYAVAAQLSTSGHDVASLVLLDAENPVFYRRIGSLKTELNKFWFYGRRIFKKGGFHTVLEHTRFRVKRLLKLSEPAATEMSMIENAILAAALRYQTPIYTGDVFLVCAEERPSCVDHYPGWKSVVQGRLTCVDVSGHHDDLVSAANASDIAKVITNYMAPAKPVYSQLDYPQSNYSVAS